MYVRLYDIEDQFTDWPNKEMYSFALMADVIYTLRKPGKTITETFAMHFFLPRVNKVCPYGATSRWISGHPTLPVLKRWSLTAFREIPRYPEGLFQYDKIYYDRKPWKRGDREPFSGHVGYEIAVVRGTGG